MFDFLYSNTSRGEGFDCMRLRHNANVKFDVRSFYEVLRGSNVKPLGRVVGARYQRKLVFFLCVCVCVCVWTVALAKLTIDNLIKWGIIVLNSLVSHQVYG
jgi:hypothetical protein